MHYQFNIIQKDKERYEISEPVFYNPKALFFTMFDYIKIHHSIDIMENTFLECLKNEVNESDENNFYLFEDAISILLQFEYNLK